MTRGAVSIDYRGVGQSGYTAGRHDHDPALDRELQARNTTYARPLDEELLQHELETDERWIGRGGSVHVEDDERERGAELH
jgi:hypothetical protein